MAQTADLDLTIQKTARGKDSHLRLTGAGLRLARLGWVALVLLTVGVYLASLPSQLSLALSELGLEAITGENGVINLYIALDLIQALGFTVVGALIFATRSDDWMAMLISLALITFGVTDVTPANGWTGPVVNFLYHVVAKGAIFVLIAVFPNGAFVPRWVRFVAALGLLFCLAHLLPAPFSPISWPDEAWFVVQYGLLGLGLIAQVYRYRCCEVAAERQQTKWLVAGLIIGVVGYFGYELAVNISGLAGFMVDKHPLGHLILVIGLRVLLVLLPVAFAFSIFRYRLWDIDALLYRAMVYSALTAVLGIIGLTLLGIFDFIVLRMFPDKSSFLSVVLTALPVAAAFKPLLNSLQSLVDRYFKPEPIGIKETLVEFSPEVRSVLGPDELVKVLAVQVRKQLHLDFAAVFLKDETGILQYVWSYPEQGEERAYSLAHDLASGLASDTGPNRALSLDSQELAQLEAGRVVEPQEVSPFSLLAPLVVARARHPDLVGVLALGPRQDGSGYSTVMKKGLHELGIEAGKAIHIARLKASGRVNGYETDQRINKGQRM
jgi:hypothetical protein